MEYKFILFFPGYLKGGLNNYQYYFGGSLFKKTVCWAPKPYCNDEGPYILKY